MFEELSPSYLEGYILNLDSILSDNWDSIEHFVFFVNDKQYSNSIMPKGEYLYERINAYKKLLNYMANKKLETLKTVYEEILMDQITNGTNQQQLLKISIQLKIK